MLTQNAAETITDTADRNGPYQILDHPNEDYEGLDIGGIDSYDQDTAESPTAMGSAIIFRRFGVVAFQLFRASLYKHLLVFDDLISF